MSQFSLEGRIALVTGGGRGIGLGIATSLAQAGADVVIADYTKELAEAGAHEMTKLGRRSAAIVVDVRKPDSVTAMVDATVKQFGRLDIAMNNAGIVSLGGIGELTVEQWDDCMNVNLRGVFLSTQGRSGRDAQAAVWPHHQHRLDRGQSRLSRPCRITAPPNSA